MNLREASYAYVSERSRNGSLRPQSVEQNRNILRMWFNAMGPDRDVQSVTLTEIAEWLAAGKVSAGTVRTRAAAVRSLYKWLLLREVVVKDPTLGLELPKPHRAVPRALSPEAVASIIDACDNSRELLIVQLMVQEGMRAGEVSGLEIGDTDLQARILVVKGKGGHERMLPMTVETKKALLVYFRDWPPPSSGTVVRSFIDGLSPLARDRICALVADVMRRAGVKRRAGDGLTGHALRHTAASDVLDECGDLRTVQEFLGHSSLVTTQVYLRRTSAGKMREAVEGRNYSVHALGAFGRSA